MKLNVKIKDGKIIEACPDRLAGSTEITCTKLEWERIRGQETAYCDGKKIIDIKADEHRKRHLLNLEKAEERRLKEKQEAEAKEALEKQEEEERQMGVKEDLKNLINKLK